MPILWGIFSFEVRRWHDLGRSGWWIVPRMVLAGFGDPVQFGNLGIGAAGVSMLVVLGLTFIAGSRDANAYGPAS